VNSEGIQGCGRFADELAATEEIRDAPNRLTRVLIGLRPALVTAKFSLLPSERFSAHSARWQRGGAMRFWLEYERCLHVDLAM
jgi:hypothetical protein